MICTKAPHDSEAAAHEASVTESEWTLKSPRPVYFCPECGRWHLGRYLGQTINCRRCGAPVIPQKGDCAIEPARGWKHTNPRCKQFARDHGRRWIKRVA